MTAPVVDFTDDFPSDLILDVTDTAAAQAAAEAQAQREAAAAWEAPVALDSGAVPPFPLDALPCVLADYVAAVSDFAEVPSDLPGVLALAVAAASVARKVALEVRPDYSEPLNLFACVAMPPGTRKSSVFADVCAPLGAFERELMEQMGPEIAGAQSRARVRVKELGEAETRAAKATGAERAKLDAAVRQLAEDVRNLRAPAEPRVMMSEATPEAVAHGLAEQGGRLLIASPEGDAFQMFRRYAKNDAPNFEIFLKGHAGDELRVDRRHAPPVTVARPALTVALAVQPHVLAGLARDPIFRERGLLARFLYAVPTSDVGRRTFDGPPVPSDLRGRYASAVLWLCRWPEQAVPLTLRVGASDAWRDFALAVERDRLPGGRFSGLLDWSGKLPGLVGRLAGVLHCVSGAAAGRIGTAVDITTMGAAIALGEYAAAHALRAFELMGADAALTDAGTVLEWLKRTGAPTFTTRELYRSVTTLKPDAARAAFRELRERGWIRPVEAAKGPVGGRPSETWAVYPGLAGA